MNPTKRQCQILDLLKEQEWLGVEEAVRILGSSPASIRRDLRVLEEAGALRRVRGGARRGDMVPFEKRELQASEEKDAIAAKAVELLRHGDVVIVDGGTTTMHVAYHLPKFRLTLITNSLRLAGYLDERSAQYPELDLFLTGGFVYPGSSLLVGPGAQASLQNYHADWAFLSAEGLDPEGLYNTNELVVESERLMIANSARSAVLIDHTKLGRRAMCRVAPVVDLDTVVCDDAPDWLPESLNVLTV
ncbi:MAG TPA: DeoR/GlpR family DNA-binding transcription regulator [Fimbriimonas sp.]